MKTESVLNVLMYLFRHHMSEDAEIQDVPRGKLVDHLEKVGFQRSAIQQAFAWLERLNDLQTNDQALRENKSLRIYNEFEKEVLDNDCLGFLHFLVEAKILTPYTRELVVHQAMELAADDEEVDVSLLKWVALMVLFSQPDDKLAMQCMEFLVLDEASGMVH